jgi:hypothetical protein
MSASPPPQYAAVDPHNNFQNIATVAQSSPYGAPAIVYASQLVPQQQGYGQQSYVPQQQLGVPTDEQKLASLKGTCQRLEVCVYLANKIRKI